MNAQTSISALFIEDDELDVELAVRALERDQIAVRAQRVDTERDLRRALADWGPEVILSDFSMPRFDGISALRIVRASAPHLPFIFLSGTIGEERAIEAIRLGATDYVLKSNLRRLGTSVRRAIEESTERQRARAAEEERSRLIEILEATTDFVGMADPEGRSIYANAAGCRMLGLSAEQAKGRDTSEFYADRAREWAVNEARLSAMRDGIWQGETALQHLDGTEIPVSQVVIAHYAPDRSVRFFSTIARDITERKRFEERIEFLANYDELTGLPNCTLMADRVAQAIAYARRKGRHCALLAAHIDRFERVDESFGHSAGDAVLKEFAARLRGILRDGDTAARLPDAFLILAADLARPDDVHMVARKVLEAAKPHVAIQGKELQFTVSVGASVYPKDGADFETMLRAAQAARNDAKASGGNTFRCYASEMTRESAERMELETALRAALDRGELQLHYQAQIEIASGRVVGAEALMRWNHPQRGWIPPGRFIPVAEESDLIVKLGEWALLRTADQLAQWRRAASGPMRVAVNVSARQFHDPGFADAVAQAARAIKGDPTCLEIELTEGVVIEDPQRTSEILHEVRALGIGVAVDDFGTGYSSLSYLSSLPIDCLKIDRSFVRKIAQGGRDIVILQAIVSLAHALGLRVLAEGVETRQELEFLRRLGCNEAQGFHFTPAVNADAFLDILQSGFPPASDQGGAR